VPADINPDYEDMLRALARHRARYLIVGGFAVAYHSRPRYTKDFDVWVDPSDANVERVNRALDEFGSPYLLDPGQPGQVVQIGLAPNRIDLLRSIEGVRFETAWKKRVRGSFGDVGANWIDIDSLLRNKRRLSGSRHREDVRVLQQVKRARKRRS